MIARWSLFPHGDFLSVFACRRSLCIEVPPQLPKESFRPRPGIFPRKAVMCLLLAMATWIFPSVWMSIHGNLINSTLILVLIIINLSCEFDEIGVIAAVICNPWLQHFALDQHRTCVSSLCWLYKHGRLIKFTAYQHINWDWLIASMRHEQKRSDTARHLLLVLCLLSTPETAWCLLEAFFLEPLKSRTKRVEHKISRGNRKLQRYSHGSLKEVVETSGSKEVKTKH